MANYPYDDSDSGKDGIYSPTADDRLFTALAYTYARSHTKMWKTGRRFVFLMVRFSKNIAI